MLGIKVFLREAGVITATTLGAGVFALPYVFLRSGWATSLFYFLILGGIVVGAHVLYWRTLDKVGEKKRLLGLTRLSLGRVWYWVGILSVVVGLLLVLVIYLILANRFIHLFWPSASWTVGLLGFWLVSVLPLLFKERRFLKLEVFGVLFIIAIIFVVFSGISLEGVLARAHAVDFSLEGLFLPFGIVLFSFAGWTAIEPLYAARRERALSTRSFSTSIIIGTLLTAALYLLFVAGIFGSAAEITDDAISGLYNWPFWRISILGVLGLFALWTSYMPIAFEVKNSLVHDLGWGGWPSLALVVFAPLALVLAGLNNFLGAVGLTGGIFASLQYVLIVLVAQRVLRLRGIKNFLSNLIVVVFLLAAVYEVYFFFIAD